MKALIVVVTAVLSLGMFTASAFADRTVQPRQGPGRDAAIGAEHLFFDDLGAFEVDVYEVKCAHSTSRCAFADICDEGGFFDTNFRVQLVGITPTSIRGRTTEAYSGVGGCNFDGTFLCRPNNGPLTAFAIVEQDNDAGPEDYSTFINCVNVFGGTAGTGGTVIKKQDE